jgi:hypothetical protein
LLALFSKNDDKNIVNISEKCWKNIDYIFEKCWRKNIGNISGKMLINIYKSLVWS